MRLGTVPSALGVLFCLLASSQALLQHDKKNVGLPARAESRPAVEAPESRRDAATEDQEEAFSLGTYKENGRTPLFGNFEDLAVSNYFAQLFTFFASQRSTVDAAEMRAIYNDTPDDPFLLQGYSAKSADKLSGQPLTFSRTWTDLTHASHTTSVFDPAKQSAVCSAWASLSKYCNGSGTECACYSGTYYVPQMYNSLAASCAGNNVAACDPDEVDCAVSALAVDQTSFCDTQVATAVRFAQHANGAPKTTKSSSSSSGSRTSTTQPYVPPRQTTEPPAGNAAASSTVSYSATTTSTRIGNGSAGSSRVVLPGAIITLVFAVVCQMG